jgi:hypothetical protein
LVGIIEGSNGATAGDMVEESLGDSMGVNVVSLVTSEGAFVGGIVIEDSSAPMEASIGKSIGGLTLSLGSTELTLSLGSFADFLLHLIFNNIVCSFKLEIVVC